MKRLTIRLPASLHREIKKLAKVEGVSINHFMTLAAAEKVSALRTLDYLAAEGRASSREAYNAFLAAVPDADPHPEDERPSPPTPNL